MKTLKIPENSLASSIKKLLKTCEKLEDDIKEDCSEFSDPASPEEIAEWERENRITLPSSYKDWLMFSNGANIRNSAAVFYSLNEIISDSQDKPYNIPDEYIVIGEMGGMGESLCFSTRTGVFFIFEDEDASELKTFDDVLKRLIYIIE